MTSKAGQSRVATTRPHDRHRELSLHCLHCRDISTCTPVIAPERASVRRSCADSSEKSGA